MAGSIFLTVAISLAELSVDVTAVRMGAADIAVGDPLGSTACSTCADPCHGFLLAAGAITVLLIPLDLIQPDSLLCTVAPIHPLSKLESAHVRSAPDAASQASPRPLALLGRPDHDCTRAVHDRAALISRPNSLLPVGAKACSRQPDSMIVHNLIANRARTSVTTPPISSPTREVPMALPKRILVPTDFSEPAAAALDYAKTLAEATRASLQVLHVMEDPLPGLRQPDHVCSVLAIREQLEREAGEQLEAVFTPEERTKFHAVTTAQWGTPHAQILKIADENHIDLIVMGTQGRGAILHALMGSVAERVVRHAKCPVLTIHSAEPRQRRLSPIRLPYPPQALDRFDEWRRDHPQEQHKHPIELWTFGNAEPRAGMSGGRAPSSPHSGRLGDVDRRDHLLVLPGPAPGDESSASPAATPLGRLGTRRTRRKRSSALCRFLAISLTAASGSPHSEQLSLQNLGGLDDR